MPTRWTVDPETEAALWSEIRSDSARAASNAPPGRILDLGGSAGSFTSRITAGVPGLRAVSIDIARPASAPECDFVLGDALRLPFKDSAFSAVAARAVLHHFPDRLDVSMAELHRVLAPGGALVVQEPCAGNPLAAVARRLFPTDMHDPGEEPMAIGDMVAAIGSRFAVSEVKPYFIFSYLAPHAVPRVPAFKRAWVRRFAKAVYGADRALLSSCRLARHAAAYVHISAAKGKK
jgi:SAM-dependent methyltransferase